MFNSVFDFFKKNWGSFFYIEKIASDKNGLIKIKKNWWSTDVMVNGYFQSGPYVTSLWKKVLKKVKIEKKVQTILMLGLGGGDGLKVIVPKFSQAKITAVDFDPKMVEIAERLIFNTMNYYPEVMTEDAEEALEHLVSSLRKFDVIIIDLFVGCKNSPLLYSENFLNLLSEVLNPQGYLLVNFFKEEKELAPIFAKYFLSQKKLRYQYNKMGIYRQKN